MHRADIVIYRVDHRSAELGARAKRMKKKQHMFWPFLANEFSLNEIYYARVYLL